LQSRLTTAGDAAQAAGRILREQLGKAAVREKAPADLVTDADLAAQKAIEAILMSRFPSYAFLGEESTEADRQSAIDSGKPLWVVDPLDGTANFVHRLPSFSVSIALVEDNQSSLGVVYDPLAETMYAVEAGGRPTRNGKPIRVSDCSRLEKAMVCCSFPPGVTRDAPDVTQFLSVLERSQSLRRLGSAALNLCYLAEGCLDAYWASSVKTWDVAAGYLIAQSAGAVFSRLDGSAFDLWHPQFVGSASPELQQQMLECMAG
jgi:myo-inositol-1(or 4)-monophosphatase